ncbi:MAG TPA: EAL domain-containing protein [Burkholderiales bacterium]|nr:EAL domain-containing protein [Burkholderiales bacterium]
MEDSETDAILALRELERAGLACVSRRVDTRDGFVHELHDFEPDVILCDFSLPGFGGLEALTIARQLRPDVPCLLVSGTVGEETAIESLKSGATDYILKSNLVRLAPAVQGALRERNSRHARRQAEQELAASEERLRLLWETTTDAVLLTDNTGRIQYANPAVREVFGYDSAELVGQDVSLIQPERLRDAHRQAFARFLETGIKTLNWRGTHLPALHRDGHEFPTEITFSHMEIGGKPVFAAFIRDISERKQTEERLRDSEYRLDLALEASGFATWEWFLATGDVRFSRHWWSILGYQPDEVPLRLEAWENLTQPDDLARVRSQLAAVVKGSTPVLDVEYQMRAKNGEWRWIRSVGRVVERDAAGRVLRMTGTHSDITKSKQAEQKILDSEARYRGLIEQASDGIFLTDTDGHFVMVNARGCELLGYALAELLGINAQDTYIEEDRALHLARVQRVLAGETLRFERMVRRKDGSPFPAEISAKLLENGLVQVIFHDISDRRAQEQKIARLRRIQTVLSGINSAIVRIRNRQELLDEACRIVVEHGGFSVGWIAMLDHENGTLVPVAQAGLPMDLNVGKQSSERPGGFIPAGVAAVALQEKRPAVDNTLEDDARAADTGVGPDTLSIRRDAIRLGAKSVVVLPLFVEEEVCGVLTLYTPERDFFDEDELKLLNELSADISFALTFIAQDEKVNYLAYYDALTGLANRTLLFDRLGQHIRAARREQRLSAIVLADIERFHVINDSLGRSAGDMLLKELARRLREHVRAEDTVARVGSDTFAIALANVGSTAEVAHLLNDRVSPFVKQAFVLAGQELRLSARFGAAIYPSDGDAPETLYANAEAALKNAKATGERFLFYAPDMNARIAESLTLENRLRGALEKEEFVLHYQPKVTVADRRIVGLEALIRWQAPDLGLVPPAKFVPLMEETGLILDAGRWALLQVARDCRRWTAQGLPSPRIAVNVSPIEMRQKNFVDNVAMAVEKIRNAGGMLDLEITESVIMEDIEAVMRKLQAISELGVRISVDDFGTGYSSLAYVARLPIHALKIDRSFVVDMTHSGDSLAIVSSVISMAHSLRLKVIAEGVETEEQATQLDSLGCDQMQGYLYSRPVPPEDVPKLLTAESRQKSPVRSRKTRGGRKSTKR